MKNAKALTITYLTPVSFASLNGSDKEADNISNIKKITRGTEQFPYVSAQAIRRALRDQLAVMGKKLSEGVAATIKKSAATTEQDPKTYIDDDLFGYMGTEEGKEGKKGKSTKRTSPIRVSPLVSLHKYEGDLDFATNFMGVAAGGDPNIFETEIHSGLYRGTILIELDRVGCGEGFEKDLSNTEKAARVKDFLTSFKNLWTSGRQTRFLADISPKFIAAAMLLTKNPIFLESVVPANGGVNVELLNETTKDYKDEIKDSVFGARKGLFSSLPDGTVSIGEVFETMSKWIDECYK
ncbi:type I-B CRISPR-associated protein Cas7/Cst2/DevR [Candidatus Desantisbacteria bacterium CG1_02_38_46]|uniref:Type I-B CRISPR-associated protein Cas7/Cst2/DevR n=3 Tax=unclassified Candidatus Desantisiibacteriota TaxID=3106372 RepID=A0A2H9PA40_9BACT|nr:MAG: type I-B CRISPR-associated protein Cas7/Cst2/DevR [Candidatus Desantisbacteria bacterium CG1_02_38_46]PIU52098.1 MAG: type I-B CRISPR-associated protein Cas7/Cst2/DevR [Candidatus Desantisbacteria bacterium CG07_land_8_20_14_0_80_39_15]PIZ15236.1 MAG: type I-B CRISPR-associated protein Cas7/Cst2/DevR [Candidatus Desantisbacteria bacterium CG_4_10_14_0_8_um_filter_39_17]